MNAVAIQCNLDLVTVLVSEKTVTKYRMVLCSKLKNGLCKIVTKSEVVTKFNVTKSRLHCSKMRHAYKVRNSALSRAYAPCTL